MHATQEKLALASKADVRTAEFVRCEAHITSLSKAALLGCSRMLSLKLSGVGLKSLEGRPFSQCPSLWWVDLSRNALESLSGAGFDAFAALGCVDVSCNALRPEALAALRSVEIVQLAAFGNAEGRRGALLYVPSVWVLDGEFVSASERAGADDAPHASDGGHRSRDDAPQSSDGRAARASRDGDRAVRPSRADAPPTPRGFFAALGGGDDYTPVEAERSMLKLHFKALEKQPRPGPARDAFRLKYLAKAYAFEATTHRQWEIERKVRCGRPTKRATVEPLPPRPPDVSKLAAAPRLDAAVLLAAAVRFDLPTKMVVEALTVLLLDSLDLNAIEELAALPAYAKSAIVYELGEACREANGDVGLAPSKPDAKPPPSHYASLDASLLAALPHVVTRFEPLLGSDLAAAVSSFQETARREALWRHAAILLSRAPSCPKLGAVGTQVGKNKAYAAVESLAAAAGLAAADVALPARAPPPPQLAAAASQSTLASVSSHMLLKISVPLTPGITFFGNEAPLAVDSPTSAAWARSNSFSKSRMGSSRMLQFAESDERSSRALLGEQPSPREAPRGSFSSYGSAMRLPPESMRVLHESTALSDVLPAKAQSAYAVEPETDVFSEGEVIDARGLRRPRAAEAVEVSDNVYAFVVDVSDDGNVIDVSPFKGQPFVASVLRAELMWDPRGWWKHTNAAAVAGEVHSLLKDRARLFRPSQGMHPSGRKCASGVPNVVLPGLEPTPGGVVELFSADAAFDAAFVVAPQRAIAAQNARTNGAQSWARLEAAPVALLHAPVALLQPRQAQPTPKRSQPRASPPAVNDFVPQATSASFVDEWEALTRLLGSQRTAAQQARRHRGCFVDVESPMGGKFQRPAEADVQPERHVFTLTALDHEEDEGPDSASSDGRPLDAKEAAQQQIAQQIALRANLGAATARALALQRGPTLAQPAQPKPWYRVGGKQAFSLSDASASDDWAARAPRRLDASASAPTLSVTAPILGSQSLATLEASPASPGAIRRRPASKAAPGAMPLRAAKTRSHSRPQTPVGGAAEQRTFDSASEQRNFGMVVRVTSSAGVLSSGPPTRGSDRSVVVPMSPAIRGDGGTY
ncbi:hypothetical protein M885DRAFT_588752 [Pelagophyceae sp. CCMP2097]|nr:hypothetical protein M885DRAFT_588752 [Pelagophyceae sp. CCMP2097]